MSAPNVLRAMLVQPATWLAGATVAMLEFGFFYWFSPGWLSAPALAAAGIGAAALMTWPMALSRSSGFRAALATQHLPLADQVTPATATLRRELEASGSSQGREQLDLLESKRDVLFEVLERRMNAGELTFGRYRDTVNQLFLATLDNLGDVVDALKSVSTIDADYLERRLAAIDQDTGALQDADPDAGSERASLEERRALLVRQQDKVRRLLGQNEQALTGLNNMAAALADTRTTAGHSAVDPETALHELKSLAARVGDYAAPR